MAVLIAVSVRHPVDERDLSEYRRAKAARFKQEDDRRRCLCAGLALDTALRTVGLREKTAVFIQNDHGKPRLKAHPDSHFSLSHSGDWAVCLLSSSPVGVDVEQIRPVPELSLAERYFAPEEAAALRNLPEPERLTAFFRLWTRKESLLKCVGVGLSGLSSVSDEGYSFREYPLAGHCLTACGEDLPDDLILME